MEPNDDLRKKIKKLVILLKKMRERDTDLSFMSENDKTMLQSLDFIIRNFENVDIQIDSNINSIPPQFQMMLDPLINMLVEELGDDFDGSISNELSDLSQDTLPETEDAQLVLKAPSADDILDTIDDAIPMKHRIMMAIQQVDEMLKKANPDSELADDLLDRRIELLQQLKDFS